MPKKFESGDFALLALEDISLEGQLFCNQLFTAVNTKALSVKESKFSQVKLLESESKNTGLLDVIFENCDLSGINISELSAQRVMFSECRLSGIQFYESTLQDVIFKNCKIDLANFRFTNFKQVVFEDCILVEADFTSSKFISTSFNRCDLSLSNFSQVKVEKLDLRTSTITTISGLSDLAGAQISTDQLMYLAPSMASTIGLVVETD